MCTVLIDNDPFLSDCLYIHDISITYIARFLNILHTCDIIIMSVVVAIPVLHIIQSIVNDTCVKRTSRKIVSI